MSMHVWMCVCERERESDTILIKAYSDPQEAPSTSLPADTLPKYCCSNIYHHSGASLLWAPHIKSTLKSLPFYPACFHLLCACDMHPYPLVQLQLLMAAWYSIV